MTAQLDKFLQSGSSVASQETIREIVAQMMQQLFAERDTAINSAFQHISTRLQQLEAAIGQVALAAQQTKLSPFEVALKALQHFGDGEVDASAQRCHDKAVALVERWLDAGLATSEGGNGDLGGAAQPARVEEALAPEGDDGDREAPPADQTEEVSAENS